ncbi:MAG: helix-turn-helix transcriptional regulator [Bradyrhizobium sp.]
MNLISSECRLLAEIFADFSSEYSTTSLRESVAPKILDLLGAQYFASYIWNTEADCFLNRVTLNMSDSNLVTYEKYFQFCDPITPALQRRRRATAVSEIMPRRLFLRTEFFNDFLAKDGLCYGVNYFAYIGNTNVGDLRIWRDSRRVDFSRRDLELLDMVGPAYANALRRAHLHEGSMNPEIVLSAALEKLSRRHGLTNRERTIYSSVLQGLSDKEIADTCGISLTTVRTHLKHVYEKTGVSSRTRLLSKLLQ